MGRESERQTKIFEDCLNLIISHVFLFECFFNVVFLCAIVSIDFSQINAVCSFQEIFTVNSSLNTYN